MNKIRPTELRFITRYDYQGRHGWWVRIQRRLSKGSAPLVISQFFADDKNGGSPGALAAAKAFRETALAQAPAPRQARYAPLGVRRGYGYLRVVGGVVSGWYRDSRGKVHRKRLSIAKWTLGDAKKQIVDWLTDKTGSPPEVFT